MSSREENLNERASPIAARAATAVDDRASSSSVLPAQNTQHHGKPEIISRRRHFDALAADGRKTSQRDLPEEAHDPTRDPRTMASQAAANALTNLARAAVGIGFAGSALSASMYDGACLFPCAAE